MDTVLGLSITPTTLGWVLAEGHGADGAILDRNELELHSGRNAQAIHTAEQLAAEVLLAHEVAAAGDHRLRVIGVTWNAEASAQAALLVESLTGAGFDNVVPVRRLRAIETLAQAIAPVIGYEQIAVCVLEHESATVVMVDTHDGKTQIAVKHVCRGLSGLTSWLTGMFGRDAWRPAGVVVVGSDSEVSEFSWQLERVLPVPVFAQTMAQVTVARGAALAAAQSTEFTDAQLVADSVSQPTVRPGDPPRRGGGSVGRRGRDLRGFAVPSGGHPAGSAQRYREETPATTCKGRGAGGAASADGHATSPCSGTPAGCAARTTRSRHLRRSAHGAEPA
ncbi:hypothetical protein J113_13065 [Mycobacterium tuberculosis CAS/NITR204]|uniref:DUF7159 domain-containing protein n=1 Tax=Mycobacterium tuberculosis CAS/NITR204 TaxID=1310114 RepID=R4MHC2_MYCTX|nr:hypothetical protein J113_13065 [Mycobacterium tuberculosis CAS/NITR204]